MPCVCVGKKNRVSQTAIVVELEQAKLVQQLDALGTPQKRRDRVLKRKRQREILVNVVNICVTDSDLGRCDKDIVVERHLVAAFYDLELLAMAQDRAGAVLCGEQLVALEIHLAIDKMVQQRAFRFRRLGILHHKYRLVDLTVVDETGEFMEVQLVHHRGETQSQKVLARCEDWKRVF
ncbi:hypothetical protein OGATHE_000470 [Ogataea polymorpha]|uniref:Uncharacterized protein n=1 Tax=Ogataea polymorpha TaxID=460523 RepID=A0A9P8PT70_9ASCO|nr:hypothetical protein OGATHE_000470 [Ogataea polymorpha]